MRREQEVERRKMLRTETKRLLWTAGSWFAAQYCVTTTRSIVRPDQTAAVLMQRPCNLPVAVSLHCVPKNETRIIARTMLSQDVCPSVCPSHAGILSKRLNLSSHLFHRRPSCSHTILVFFSKSNVIAIFRQGPLTGASNAKTMKNRYFRPIFRFISEMIQDTRNNTSQNHSYYGMRIGNRTQAPEWCHFEWPWVT